jgi:hypothetical protein
MVNLVKLRKVFEARWDKSLSYDKDYDSQPIRSKGQCFPTALCLQKALGGKVIKGKVGKESHFWNILPTGLVIDFTSDQYGGDGFHQVPEAIVVDTDYKPKSENSRVKKLWEMIRIDLMDVKVHCEVMS